MPDTVDDFMSRFGGDKTVDDRDAARYHERFVSTHEDDRDFDNKTYHQSATEYLGKMPEPEFNNAARTAIAKAPPQERKGFLSGLLGALGGGGGFGGLASMLGLGSIDPDKMSEGDAARVMDYARRERPEVLQKVVEEKPWFMKAMGNPVVLGALTMAAAKLLQNQRRRS
jgi:hypothetical protein